MDKYESYSCWLSLVFEDKQGWEHTHQTPTFEVMAVNKRNAEKIARAVAFMFDNLPGNHEHGVQISIDGKVFTLTEHHVHVAALG